MLMPIFEARRLTERTMETIGHTPAEAAIIADHLIDCELRGLQFGGLPRALSIVERIRATTRPRRPIEVIKETATSASLDGGDQVGYLVGRRATEMAIEKARSAGLAVVAARETWYTGMFSYYLERVTQAGFAGMIAGSAPPRVAPHGGTESRFGTNPIAFGFPSTSLPVIWDIGTSALMSGEVMLANRLGQSLPEGSAFDVTGRPTRNPAAALQGAFAVWGGHKGSGLAMTIQLLGMLSGAAAAPPIVEDCGFLIWVVDPGLLTDAQDYKQRVSDYADNLRATRPLDPGKSVRVPFERSAEERSKRLATGTIEVADAVYRALAEIVDSKAL